jgi:hypothetical protein
MLTAERRADILPLWAGLVSLIAIYFLTSNVWKALLIAVFVAGSAMLGYGARWVLMGSFAIAVFAIAVAARDRRSARDPLWKGNLKACSWLSFKYGFLL